MRVLCDRLNVVWSSKVTPSVEFTAVSSVSFLKIGSAVFNAIAEALPRTTVTLPCSVATWPTDVSVACAGGAGGGGFCARAGRGQIAGQVASQAAAVPERSVMNSRRFMPAQETPAKRQPTENGMVTAEHGITTP